MTASSHLLPFRIAVSTTTEQSDTRMVMEAKACFSEVIEQARHLRSADRLWDRDADEKRAKKSRLRIS